MGKDGNLSEMSEIINGLLNDKYPGGLNVPDLISDETDSDTVDSGSGTDEAVPEQPSINNPNNNRRYVDPSLRHLFTDEELKKMENG